jgi:hypothetical protein
MAVAQPPGTKVITVFTRGIQGPPGTSPGGGGSTEPGPPGKSAYELDVEAGTFTGTLEEWLASLHGAPGASAYQLAVDAGTFTGTLEEWLASLKREDGEDATGGGGSITLDQELLLLTGHEKLPFANDQTGKWNFSGVRWLGIIDEGQSNRVGFGGAGTVDPVIDWMDDRIFQFSPDGGLRVVGNVAQGTPAYAQKLIKASDPLRHPAGEAGHIDYLGPSPGMATARALLPYLPPGMNIVILPCAVGGTGLASGSWQVGGTLFNQVVATANQFIAEVSDAKIGVILTGQGELDAITGVTGPYYQELFDAKYVGYRTMIPTAEDAMIVIGGMVPEWYSDPSRSPTGLAIDEVHRLTPMRLPRAFYVNAPHGMNREDVIHLTADGCRVLGRDMADAAHSACLLSGGDLLDPPDNLEAIGATAVEFTVPATLAPLYAIETRPAGSEGAWTRVIYSPTENKRAGDRMQAPLPVITVPTEVRVASLTFQKEAFASAVITVDPPLIVPPWADLDFASATVSNGKVLSVPSVGTNATPWTAEATHEPTPVTDGGHAVMATTIGQSLIGPALPQGPFTALLRVKLTDFEAFGTFLTGKTAYTTLQLWRNSTNKLHFGINGHGGAIVGPPINTGEWLIIGVSGDPGAAPEERLALYQNGLLVAYNGSYPISSDFFMDIGLRLNGMGNVQNGGNNGRYSAFKLWTSRLTDSTMQAETDALLSAFAA